MIFGENFLVTGSCAAIWLRCDAPFRVLFTIELKANSFQ
jgi:hypothetical protein